MCVGRQTASQTNKMNEYKFKRLPQVYIGRISLQLCDHLQIKKRFDLQVHPFRKASSQEIETATKNIKNDCSNR
jgi:hypothetical protein